MSPSNPKDANAALIDNEIKALAAEISLRLGQSVQQTLTDFGAPTAAKIYPLQMKSGGQSQTYIYGGDLSMAGSIGMAVHSPSVADPASCDCSVCNPDREKVRADKRAALLKELQALGPARPKEAEDLDPVRSIRVVR